VQRVNMPDNMRVALATLDYPELKELDDFGTQGRWLDELAGSVPGLDDLLARADEALNQVGGIIIKNCITEPDAAVALLCAHFGHVDPRGNGAPSRLVFDVTARRAADGNFSMAATSRGAGEFWLHSDSSNFERPHEFAALACVRAPRHEGGESMILSADAIAAELEKREQLASLKLLEDPVYPFMVGYRSPDEIIAAPIMTSAGGRWRIRYSRGFVQDGLAVNQLDGTHSRALADFETVLLEPSIRDHFMLRPGDLWVLDNLRWLHGRREFDPHIPRLLKRCKIYARNVRAN
jgi:alpha-ketoglutarate-dependent taurine dioxygenase